MPKDLSRISYDENGGQVTEIPKGTPKEEIKAARARGEKTINDPGYTVDDAKKDAGTVEEKVEDDASQENVRAGQGPVDGKDNDPKKDDAQAKKTGGYQDRKADAKTN